VPGEAAAERWQEEAVMYGDTSAIRAHARRMRERGSEIRSEAHAVLRDAEAVPWTGLAAEAMRRLAREHAAELQACAAAHDRAADALERHAREVDHLKDLIASIERRVLGAIDAAASGLAGLVGQVVPSPLDRWARSFDPPPHGSRAWLDVRLPDVA
jgi:uncharacterized protein YukE